jgi:outer membrane lipoprotein SlyB
LSHDKKRILYHRRDCGGGRALEIVGTLLNTQLNHGQKFRKKRAFPSITVFQIGCVLVRQTKTKRGDTMEKRFEEKKPTTRRGTDANRDPITGEPGSHPVGTGVGAAGAGAAGAAIGTAVGGPVGGVVGAVVGAVAGGYAGKAVGEVIDPTREDAYWRDNYSRETWAEKDYSYDDYQPALRTGYEGYSRYGTSGKSYDQAEADLAKEYEKSRGQSRLSWEKAKEASRAAWNRAERALPGDADKDGR